MALLQEFSELVEVLKTERDEIKLKLHLASMDINDEYERLDDKWDFIAQRAAELADEAEEVSEEAIAAAKVIGEELKDAYQRICARLAE